MSEEAGAHPECQVCGRRLLPGERPSDYFTRDGAAAVVCELCKPRAEAAGWLRPEQAHGLDLAAASRERRRPRGQLLGGLLSRLPAAVDGGEGEAVPARYGHDPRADAPASADIKAATSIAAALAAFNRSNHRRTVAGLSRTLGPPRASALGIQVQNGDPGVRLTVAWELTWYQWEVAPGSGGPDVRESGKGETIDQLQTPDRSWNLMVDSDGSLEQRTTGIALEGGAA